MLSFLNLHGKNVTQKCRPEFGGLVWRHLTPNRKKMQYRCTTTIHHVHNSPKDVLENLLPIRLLVRTNLFILSHFWTTYTNFDNCCLRYIATCGKKIIHVHIYILGTEPQQWNILQICQLSI